MTEEEQIKEHLSGYPMRLEEQNRRFTSIDDRLRNQDIQLAEIKSLVKIVEHQEPSPKTMVMFDELQKRNDRVDRVLFGDPLDKNDIGMQEMLRDIHEKLSGEAGFWERMFFIAKVSGAIMAIAFLVTGIISFVKKF